MAADLLERKTAHFVLWRPRHTSPPPRLIIGTFQPGNPPAFVPLPSVPLTQSLTSPDLWEVPATACGLTDRRVYHYWFEVLDSNPDPDGGRAIQCTDPSAWTVDWRALAPRLPKPT